jgi:hypothetical protein
MNNKGCKIVGDDIIGPDGTVYTIKHLSSTEVEFELKIKNEVFNIPIWIVYRDHCYSRDFDVSKEGDQAHWLMPVNPLDKNRRLFCKDRWSYSCSLPAVISNLIANGLLYRTTNNGLYYRLERSSRASAHSDEGIYLFFKFSPNKRKPTGVVLSVESVHERNNRPGNDRGRQSLKFWEAVRELVEKKHPHILEELRKQKAQ